MSGPGFIDALLRPASVALVGASGDAARVTGRPLAWLRRHGFAGNIYPVNPNRDRVLGERAWASLADLPEPVDHAYILVGRDRVIDAVRDCAAAGIKLATVLADGFAEAGEAGRARQEKLRAVAAEGGVRILGPNSLGVVVPETGLALSANAALQEERLLTGRLMLLSQSGSMIGALLSRGIARGIGFSALISVGNEADLSIGEIGSAAVRDRATSAFLLFIEAIRDREALAGFARAAHDAGKPVIAYRLGRSAAGREAAVSHTGALLGSGKAVDAYLAAHGIARVEQLETLLEAPALFEANAPGRRARRAAVASTTGGGGAMIVDRLGMSGVEVVGLTGDERTALAAQGIEIAPGVLTDLTLAGTRYEVMHAVLGTLMNSPENEVVVAAAGSSARFQPELAVQPIVDRARNGGKPLAVFTVPDAPGALRLLAAADVAAFRTPEACADGVRAFLDWRPPGKPPKTATPRLPNLASEPTELDGYRLLEALGIPVAPYLVCEAGPPKALPFDFPVAAKALSPDIVHKTEAGGVRPGIADNAGLKAAVREVRERTGVQTLLIQHMARGLGEVLLGYRRDPQVGPVVTLASGGLLAEIYGDAAARLAPAGPDDAREMIAEVGGLAPLRGYRGLPVGDLAALADAIVAFSRLALVRNIAEAEINPLIVRSDGEGVVAVDAFVSVA